MLENLRSINLDFASALCPLGCCRALDFCWTSIMQAGRKIRILGLMNEQEKDTIQNDWLQEIDGPDEDFREECEVDFVVGKF